MLFGEGCPWWSAQAAMGEPANAKPAPAAVRKNSRLVGLMALSTEFRCFAGLELGIFAPVLSFMLYGSLGFKLVARTFCDQGR